MKQIYIVRHRSVVRMRRCPDEGPEREEMDRKSLNRTLTHIQKLGTERGLDITTDEMAEKLGLTRPVLEAYLNGGDKAPQGLTMRLRDAYKPLLDAAELQRNRESLQHTVVVVRNHGLAKGMDITLDQMAGSIGLTREELITCLKGETDPVNDPAARLNAAWEKLLEDAERIRIDEDLDVIMKNEPKAG